MTAPNPVKFGRGAGLIRAAMEQRDISAEQLAARLDMHPANVYLWISARGAPGGRARLKLQEVLGIDPEVFPPGRWPTPQKQLPAVREVERPHTVPYTVKSKPSDVLSFTIDGEGSARIRLDIVLPLARATPLLRMLLDVGLITRDRSADDLIESEGADDE